MNESKATRNVTVTNDEGFHLRAATAVVNLARRYESRIAVIKGNHVADAKSTPLHLVSLGAELGEQVVLEAEGSDAQAAVDALADLFASNFPCETPEEAGPEPAAAESPDDNTSAG